VVTAPVVTAPVVKAYDRSAGWTRMPPGTSTSGDWTKAGSPACQASLPLAALGALRRGRHGMITS